MNTIIQIDTEKYELKDLGIKFHTISFYSQHVGTESNGNTIMDEQEANFGTCDLTGIRGNVVPCVALDDDGNIVNFEVLECIVHGGEGVKGALLGRLAGAF
jgi:hypothetical protein